MNTDLAIASHMMAYMLIYMSKLNGSMSPEMEIYEWKPCRSLILIHLITGFKKKLFGLVTISLVVPVASSVQHKF